MRHFTENPKVPFSFDLHVLGTPPAFILSQDQTLQFNSEVAFCATNRSLLYLADWFSKIDFSLTGRRPPRQSELKQIIVLLELCQQKSSLFLSTHLPEATESKEKALSELRAYFDSGGVLLSHTAARAVPSAQSNLTSVFGMGCSSDALFGKRERFGLPFSFSAITIKYNENTANIYRIHGNISPYISLDEVVFIRLMVD